MKFKKLFIIALIIGYSMGFFYISYAVSLNDLPNDFINVINYKYNEKKINFKIDLFSLVIKNYKSNNYFILNNKKIDFTDSNLVKPVLYSSSFPIVYIYNTHTNEEYNYQKNNLYNITPTVLTASYILQDELEKFGIDCIVEENNVTNTINERGLSYSSSYKVSREFLENKKVEYPSLIYFIDLHRDSVGRNITTTSINNITYAKTMFLLGLENEKYEDNKKELQLLNNYLDTNYKGLSRGIYEKKGKGVNGIYNQDMSKYTMLIEVGGQENTIDEVANSIKVIALMLKDYITSNKTT